MWLNWLPWRYLVRRAARAQGFVDPISVLAHLHRFAQPSEVAAPLELLRAGVVFHARGLMNTGAIQHNLDWIWPYWVERQFDPHDDAFIPRAFSITHVNLTHRNWTAVGLPDHDWLPLVDPRGLLTPYWDGWSIDAWVLADDGRELIPAQQLQAQQQLEMSEATGVAVVTRSTAHELTLETRAEVTVNGHGAPVCREYLKASADQGAWLVVSLRPANPEGVKFVHDIELDAAGRAWLVDGARAVEFCTPVDRHRMSNYRRGDVRSLLVSEGLEQQIRCDVGMATAAAMFRIEPGQPRQVQVEVARASDPEPETVAEKRQPHQTWRDALAGHCELAVPDEKFQFLYEAAVRTLVLHSPTDVYPGPYTYKRFWYRDAAFILHAMLCAGLIDRSERALNRFPLRQTRKGYFRSQEGEWDSNGEALWIMHRYCLLTGRSVPDAWRRPILRAAQWIIRKRLPEHPESPHAGLLPSGFSAEHLGPNDYYYWDDFWSVTGLLSAAAMTEARGDHENAARYRREAKAFSTAIERSLKMTAADRNRPGVPASPYRRMDAGAIGSLAAGYPLQLWAADDRRLLDTADFLVKECFYKGGFFQDMIHSGINAYLTLHVAQVELRAGNARFMDHVRAVADLASPTGQWPEAIHPRTLGGCMGDGQHVWAAAEWILMMRSLFVREESDRIILCSGIPRSWLRADEVLRFGPTPTPWGSLTVTVQMAGSQIEITWDGEWRKAAPKVEILLQGFPPLTVDGHIGRAVLSMQPTSTPRADVSMTQQT